MDGRREFLWFSCSGERRETIGFRLSCGLIFVSVHLQKRLQPCIQLYLLPILLRGDVVNYCKAFSLGFLCFLLFMVKKHIKGWGHVLFHVVATPFSLVLLEASKNV